MMLKCIANYMVMVTFGGFDLSSDMVLATRPGEIFAGFAKPSRLTLKQNLFNTHVHKTLFKAIRGNATNDMKDGFTQERLFWGG